MTRRIAFLGAGAVGAPAALLAARASKDAEITVIDANVRPSGSRTFVLLCGVCERLKDAQAWDLIKDRVHRITSVKSDFDGSFGSLSLAGDDCDSDHVGHSIAEDDLLDAMRNALSRMDNVKVLDGAEVLSVTRDGEVVWQEPGGQEKNSRFDLIAIAGLPEKTLVEAGFAFSTKTYDHLALVSTFSCAKPSDMAHERFLRTGASTLVPRKDGYGHVLISSAGAVRGFLEKDDDEFVSAAAEKGWLPEDAECTLVARGSFTPRMRVAKNPGLGKAVLLGATACTVHPIGAQELNLGLRDALELADMLCDRQEAGIANLALDFAQRRSGDRRKIARMTDLAAMATSVDIPGKLCVAGLAATAIDICPPARRMLLGTIILP